MRYLALVTDYDGTLAFRDRVSTEAVRAMDRLRMSGRRAILVTGRRLDDLLGVCSCAQLFDLVVAENGAIVYAPATREEETIRDGSGTLFVTSFSRTKSNVSNADRTSRPGKRGGWLPNWFTLATLSRNEPDRTLCTASPDRLQHFRKA